MKNRESLLLIIIMVLSASLVAFLYSPVVTKNDFGSDGFGLNPGVNFGGKVVNSKKKDNSFSIPDRSMPIFTANAISNVSSSDLETNNSKSTVSGQLNENITTKSGTNRYVTQNSSTTSYSGISQNTTGNTFTNRRSRQMNDLAKISLYTSSADQISREIPSMNSANYRINSSASSNGFIAIVSDVTRNLTSDYTGMQKTGGGVSGKLTDPGSSGPIRYNSGSLPIPDGTYYLLFLVVGYLFLKRQWVPKSKRVSPPVPKKEYELQFESKRLS